jgi:hypothetical protein
MNSVMKRLRRERAAKEPSVTAMRKPDSPLQLRMKVVMKGLNAAKVRTRSRRRLQFSGDSTRMTLTRTRMLASIFWRSLLVTLVHCRLGYGAK